MWLKRPVYRGFKCEGKCEGKCFTLTLTLTPSHFRQESILLVRDSCIGYESSNTLWQSENESMLAAKEMFSYGLIPVLFQQKLIHRHHLNIHPKFG